MDSRLRGNDVGREAHAFATTSVATHERVGPPAHYSPLMAFSWMPMELQFLAGVEFNLIRAKLPALDVVSQFIREICFDR
jgi:hypothetical protein